MNIIVHQLTFEKCIGLLTKSIKSHTRQIEKFRLRENLGPQLNFYFHILTKTIAT